MAQGGGGSRKKDFEAAGGAVVRIEGKANRATRRVSSAMVIVRHRQREERRARHPRMMASLLRAREHALGRLAEEHGQEPREIAARNGLENVKLGGDRDFSRAPRDERDLTQVRTQTREEEIAWQRELFHALCGRAFSRGGAKIDEAILHVRRVEDDGPAQIVDAFAALADETAERYAHCAALHVALGC